jgi:SAM-dependent methyltransferase
MRAEVSGEPVIGGNVYPKYTTRNPIARALVDGFLAQLDALVATTGARTIHEVGCGEGFLTTRLARAGFAVRGSDLSPAAIGAGRRRLASLGVDADLRVRDLYALTPPEDAAELMLCCEVLEHVPEPERALAQLATLARPHLILSVPREPLWRILNIARGKYLGDLGNMPGHLQHFSTTRLSASSAAMRRSRRSGHRCPGPCSAAAAAEGPRPAIVAAHVHSMLKLPDKFLFLSASET